MKKTGLEIIEMIAKGQAPKKIKWASHTWEYKKNYFDNYGDSLDIIRSLNDEFEIIEEPKVWKPKESEKYYVFDEEVNIVRQYWANDEFDNIRYEIGNCFKTEEEAQKTLEKINIYMQLKRYAEEHNTEKIDWNNSYQTKFYLYYEIDGNLEIGDVCCSKHIGQVYFTSEEIAEQAIEEIGEDNIKKLFED